MCLVLKSVAFRTDKLAGGLHYEPGMAGFCVYGFNRHYRPWMDSFWHRAVTCSRVKQVGSKRLRNAKQLIQAGAARSPHAQELHPDSLAEKRCAAAGHAQIDVACILRHVCTYIH